MLLKANNVKKMYVLKKFKKGYTYNWTPSKHTI